jgi:hypothetical protein
MSQIPETIFIRQLLTPRYTVGRFKIWAGNIGAFQPFDLKSSLDFRLRDTPKISTQILEILDDLAESLEDGAYFYLALLSDKCGSDFGPQHVPSLLKRGRIARVRLWRIEKRLKMVLTVMENRPKTLKNCLRFKKFLSPYRMPSIISFATRSSYATTLIETAMQKLLLLQ